MESERHRETSRTRKIGPLLPIASLVVASAILVSLLAVHGVNIFTFAEALGVLTKVSALLFVVVFATRPLHQLIRNSTTTWMLANRRYLGLSFAAWHLMHWPILGGIVALVGPAQFWEYFSAFAVPAFGVLAVITVLAATSNNRAQRFLGKRVWSAIHTVGIYVIWCWFIKVYVGKVIRPDVQSYVYVYLGLLGAAMVLRLAVAVWTRARHRYDDNPRSA